jgi:hypothetical protein
VFDGAGKQQVLRFAQDDKVDEINPPIFGGFTASVAVFQKARAGCAVTLRRNGLKSRRRIYLYLFYQLRAAHLDMVSDFIFVADSSTYRESSRN